MYRLSLVFWTLIVFVQIKTQSPHGELFRTDCATCHNSSSWDIDIDTFHYDHSEKKFPLDGVHLVVDCKSCHTSLIFNEAPMQCASCHSDLHSMSVGNDCVRCHNTSSWLVDHIPELHEQNGFPLVGAHDL